MSASTSQQGTEGTEGAAPTVPAFTVVVASRNRGKAHELAQLFADTGVEVLAVDQVLTNPPVVQETGATFEDNALLKAHAVARATGLVTLADDSGLEVTALGGRPGVRSARFAHEGATDAENNAALLAALEDVESDERTACFRCVLALVDPFEPDIDPFVVEGRCEGRITSEARGTGGFGYDPLFFVIEQGRTFAELSDAEKNRVSHRARAAEQMREHLAALVDRRRQNAAALMAGSAP